MNGYSAWRKKRRAMKNRGVLKKGLIAWLKLAGVILAAGIFLASIRIKTEEPIQVRTDTEPIYNHFPDLPETSEIRWCSQSSEGIGLTTVNLYIFTFYDDDISNELQDMKIKDEGEDIELYFVSDGIENKQKWRRVENAGFAFQKEIKDTEKMHTDVYINEAGTMLYIEAVGD